MRVLSFIVFILGCIICFSDASVGWGVALMVLGALMNIFHHFSNAIDDHRNHRN